jgi:hypothetical protein
MEMPVDNSLQAKNTGKARESGAGAPHFSRYSHRLPFIERLLPSCFSRGGSNVLRPTAVDEVACGTSRTDLLRCLRREEVETLTEAIEPRRGG